MEGVCDTGRVHEWRQGKVTPVNWAETLQSMTYEQLGDLHSDLADAHHSLHLAWRKIVAAGGGADNPMCAIQDALYAPMNQVYAVFRAKPEHPLNQSEQTAQQHVCTLDCTPANCEVQHATEFGYRECGHPMYANDPSGPQPYKCDCN